MRKLLTLLALGTALLPGGTALARVAAPAPVQSAAPFTFEKLMVPMRDGAKLETVILRPRDQKGPLPILLSRTPYGVPEEAPRGVPGSWAALAKDGYIFVQQSMRGRFGSDGTFTLSNAITPGKGVDEASDAYDTIDWLVKHVADNNGRVGMWGVSYPGLTAAIALAKPHPALKAVSPQAAWTDYWMNDDLHRNGAMRLTYATDWLYMLQWDKTDDATFEYDRYDTYDWFLNAGSPADIEAKYLKGRVPMFSAMLDHPDYDDFWKKQVWTDHLPRGATKVATLNVAGFWDQEDPWGSWQIYAAQEAHDPGGLNFMVSGPWNHGSWRGPGNALGRIPIPAQSGTEFREQIEAPFFAHFLHGTGKAPGFEAAMFQSGSWQWKRYAKWPVPSTPRSLYLHADGSLSFDAPAEGEACRDYLSDPNNPVPFRERPISPTYPAPEWQWWEAADQRFVAGRPDVLSWVSAPLAADLTITGEPVAHLFASTTGTDSDFVVKLIDVYPEDYEAVPRGPLGAYTNSLNGYQLPIGMQVKRGRYLKDRSHAAPLTPGKVEEWPIPLNQKDHVFKAGHRIMVQVQSSWFPMIDRNPQTFVPNLYKAKPGDYQKATQRVCRGSQVTLPVVG